MEDKEQEQRYTNGFNDGYLLSRFEPDLLEKLNTQAIKGNPYFDGLTEGSKQHRTELFQENLAKSRAIMGDNPRPRMK